MVMVACELLLFLLPYGSFMFTSVMFAIAVQKPLEPFYSLMGVSTRCNTFISVANPIAFYSLMGVSEKYAYVKPLVDEFRSLITFYSLMGVS